ncbi:MAG: hypothetical protein LBM96_10770 [Methanobrevibacter sp.]|jgi:hypothetical protein|nr:hypothetical protein [Candidatus Methanoflexus mossambicus]
MIDKDFNEFKKTLAKDCIVENIYDTNLKIFSHEQTLLDKKMKLEECKKTKENKLKEVTNETDFKSKGITNQQGRDAYLAPISKRFDEEIFKLKKEINKLELKIDKIKKINKIRESIFSKIETYDELSLDDNKIEPVPYIEPLDLGGDCCEK